MSRYRRADVPGGSYFFTVVTEPCSLVGRVIDPRCNLAWAAAATPLGGLRLRLTRPTSAERFGFVHEGLFRQHMVIKGENRDSAWFAILDGEWPSRRSAFQRWLAADNFDAQGRQKRRLEALRG